MKSLRHLVLLCLTSLTLSIQFCQSTDSPAEDGAATEETTDGSSEETPAEDGSTPAADTNSEMPTAENPTTPPIEVQNSALNAGTEESIPPENLVPPAPVEASTPLETSAPLPAVAAPIEAIVDAPKPEGSVEEVIQTPPTPESSISSATAIPELGSKMAYHIVRGDTLGVIAQKIFGDKSRWKELAQTNNLKNPDQVYAGDVIFYVLDDRSKSFSEQYEMAPKKTVTVQKGDSLSLISKKVYGHQGQWRSLWKLNPELKNPHKLKVGQVLNYVEWGTVSIASVEAPAEKVAEEAKPEEIQPEVVNSNETVSDNNVVNANTSEELANANVNTEDSAIE